MGTYHAGRPELPIVIPSYKTFPDPAAGASVLVATCPADKAWKVHWGFIRLVSSASVANREISLAIHDSQFTGVLVSSDATLHIAGQNDVITFMPGTGVAGMVSTAHYVAPLPQDTWLRPGWSATVLGLSIQSTDQLQDYMLLVSEYNV